MPRDAQRTKASILDAAVAEFSAHGYAGARIDRIASLAGVNKRMIYHHFGGKRVVFEAVLADRLAMGGDDEQLVRLWMHEALERGDDDIVRSAERRKLAAERIDAIRAAQRNGTLPRTPDAPLLALAKLALDVFPTAFPQLVRIVTGTRAASPEFDEAWRNFVRTWPELPSAPAKHQRDKPRLRVERGRVLEATRRSDIP